MSAATVGIVRDKSSGERFVFLEVDGDKKLKLYHPPEARQVAAALREVDAHCPIARDLERCALAVETGAPA